jgi:hypothetical protein
VPRVSFALFRVVAGLRWARARDAVFLLGFVDFLTVVFLAIGLPPVELREWSFICLGSLACMHVADASAVPRQHRRACLPLTTGKSYMHA